MRWSAEWLRLARQRALQLRLPRAHHISTDDGADIGGRSLTGELRELLRQLLDEGGRLVQQCPLVHARIASPAIRRGGRREHFAELALELEDLGEEHVPRTQPHAPLPV